MHRWHQRIYTSATHCNTLQHTATQCAVIQQEYVLAETEGSCPQLCALRCSAVQCGAVRCSAVQCIAVHCSALQCIAVHCSALQCIAVHCSALQSVAVRCRALQSAGEVMQSVAVHLWRLHCRNQWLSWKFRARLWKYSARD